MPTSKKKVVRRLRHETMQELVARLEVMSAVEFAKVAKQVLHRDQVNYAGETSLGQQMFEEVHPYGE